LLEDLLGVKYEYTVPIPEGFLDHLKGTSKKLRIITKKMGKGKVHYANFSLFLEIKKDNKIWAKRLQTLLDK
jgi:hypothetical protein